MKKQALLQNHTPAIALVLISPSLNSELVN